MLVTIYDLQTTHTHTHIVALERAQKELIFTTPSTNTLVSRGQRFEKCSCLWHRALLWNGALC